MGIPTYPAAAPLSLDHKPLLDGVFAGLQPRISELTFANLYLFRAAHDYRLTMVDDALVVLGKGYDGRAYFLPPLTGGVADALARLFAHGLTLYGADEPFVRQYLQGGDDLEVTEDRDNCDYLYLRSELAELPGNRYHKKKNRISYFTTRHSFSVEAYGDSHWQGAAALLDEWHRVHSQTGSDSLLLEVAAAREALAMVEQLGLKGLVVLVEGAIKAFVLGEKLNDDTSVCHFQKADPFLDGLYQLADREFNRILFKECTYVNREQDLGEAKLRESKLSYHPLELVKKYRASRKERR